MALTQQCTLGARAEWCSPHNPGEAAIGGTALWPATNLVGVESSNLGSRDGSQEAWPWGCCCPSQHGYSSSGIRQRAVATKILRFLPSSLSSLPHCSPMVSMPCPPSQVLKELVMPLFSTTASRPPPPPPVFTKIRACELVEILYSRGKWMHRITQVFSWRLWFSFKNVLLLWSTSQGC